MTFFEKIERNLYSVSPKKPVGYMPINELDGIVNKVENWIDTHYKYGIRPIQLSQYECWTNLPTLIIFHLPSVRELIRKHRDLLVKARIPYLPQSYVKYVMKHKIDETIWPKQYIIVAQSFGDERFKYTQI